MPVTDHMMITHKHTIQDRSPRGSTSTAPSAVHQDGGVKYATGALSKIRGRDNINMGTWNTRTLRAAGKLQELTHEMDRYRWNILGLCQKSQRAVENRGKRRKLVAKSSVVPQRPSRLRDR